VNTGGTVTLVNDNAGAPHPYTYYGTDNGSILGYHSFTYVGFNYVGSSVFGGTGTPMTALTGIDNTIVGWQAGDQLSSGTDNTLYGFRAGSAITSGSNNTVIGSNENNNINSGITTGNNNIFIGVGVGDSGDGTGSSNIGIQGSWNSTAADTSYNILIGGSSQGGNQNIMIGSSCAAGNTPSSNSNLNVALSPYTYFTNALQTISIGCGAGAYIGGDANYTIALGTGVVTNQTDTGCFMVGNALPNGGPTTVKVTTGPGQITFGTSGAHAITLQDMFLGRGAVGDATATNVSIQPSPTVGSNIAGANLTIRAGNGTGTGGSGAINFQTAPSGSTGSTANTLATVMSLSKTGAVAFSGSTGTTGQFLTSNGSTAAPTWTSGGSGTVTSVAMTVPSFLSISGSPITTSGTLGLTLSGTALPGASGGTGLTSVTQYEVMIGGASNALAQVSGVGTTGQVLTSNGTGAAPTWQAASGGSLTAPTVQKFVIGNNGTYTFTVTPANATSGATYTNNGQTYTVSSTISSGTTLTTTAAPNASFVFSNGTLTKASGTGDATITFTSIQLTGTYTRPTSPTPLYIRVKMAGGGGGGGGAGSGSGNGKTGSASTFGTSLLSCSGGSGGFGTNGGLGGLGGPGGGGGIVGGAIGDAITGGQGGDGYTTGSIATAGYMMSGAGGANARGGGGMGTTSQGNGAGYAGALSTGAGGSGGTAVAESSNTGGGGGASGYVDAIITSPSSTYTFAVGVGGYGGIAGASANAGGGGGTGIIIVEEMYQ
jgi:hypothetical protein